MAGERKSRSVARAEANRQIRMAVKRFDQTAQNGETWAFLCECGDDGCKQWITLTLPEYEKLQRMDDPILAPGHTLEPAQKARRRARKLADDAAALRAQAEHQQKRARRNAGDDA